MRKRPVSKDDHLRLPTGLIVSEDPVKGEHTALPLFAWVSVRERTQTPLLMLLTLLLDETVAELKGSLQIEVPLMPETEPAALCLLDRLGWNGKVWPHEAGWPTGSGENEAQIKELMGQTGLKAAMVFPPIDNGNTATMPVNVQRARGPFLMPPLVVEEAYLLRYNKEPKDPEDEEKILYFRQLCANPSVFFRNVVKPPILM